eukprot:2186631-Amphidinium_carterae.1
MDTSGQKSAVQSDYDQLSNDAAQGLCDRLLACASHFLPLDDDGHEYHVCAVCAAVHACAVKLQALSI